MATPKDIDADLTLEIDGRSITPDKFLKGIRAFFGILSAVTKDICGDQPPVSWIVQVKSGSNLVGVIAEPGVPIPVVKEIATAVQSGIKTLENKSEEPEHFPTEAIKQLKDLGTLVGIEDEDDTTIRIWIKRDPTDITYKTVVHATGILRDGVQDYGSIEGKLQTVSERGGFHFVIYEPIWDKAVRCYISSDLIRETLESFGKRVEAIGTIKYRKDGTPLSIKVDKVIPFPESEDIPNFRSVRGILRKYK